MLVISNKQDCCGCSACMEICPQKCIIMQADDEGFLYPSINQDVCINCNLCTKTCPILNQHSKHKPIHLYAAVNPNENIRLKSSSGGVFSLLAEYIINRGGTVFGASFNEQWNVVHEHINDISDIDKFRNSKYVQSNINGQFSKVEEILNRGQEVLFSGTPCQIAGLKRYLRQDYSLLYTVDFICHGVPSPLVWQSYLNETLHQYKIERKNIQKINFRDKSIGWKKFCFALQYTKNGKTKKIAEVFYRNYYIRGFLYNIYLRPSCYACPAKSGKSSSDITIADFWGIQQVFPEFYNNGGINLVMTNSIKGHSLYQQLNIPSKETDYLTIFPFNKSIETSASYPQNKRKLFFQGLGHKSTSKLICQLTDLSLYEQVKNKIQNILSQIKQ